MNATKKTTKAKSTLHLETIAVLRNKIKALETKVNGLISYSAGFENRTLASERRAKAAEKQSEVLYDALRILANVTSNKLTAEREARTAARKLLEKNNIQPPKTLGASRNRKSGKKKKT
jgi:hypothetical protein